MINVNVKTGEIQFENIIINPNDKKTHILNCFVKDSPKLWIDNNEWETYRIEIQKEFILLITFFKESVTSIDIGTYTEADENSGLLENLLHIMGGSNEYRWGTISLEVDMKAGGKSIFIRYKK